MSRLGRLRRTVSKRMKLEGVYMVGLGDEGDALRSSEGTGVLRYLDGVLVWVRGSREGGIGLPGDPQGGCGGHRAGAETRPRSRMAFARLGAA